MAQAFNPSTWEAEASRWLGVQGQPCLHSVSSRPTGTKGWPCLKKTKKKKKRITNLKNLNHLLSKFTLNLGIKAMWYLYKDRLIHQMDLRVMYGIFPLRTKEYTSYGMFSNINHILGKKNRPQQIKKIEIIPCILSDHNAINLKNQQKQKKP